MSTYNLFTKVFNGTRIIVVQILLLLSSNCILAQKSNVDIEDNIRSSLDEFVSALSELNHSTTTTSINSLFGGANYFCINGNIATFSSFLNNYNSCYLKNKQVNHEIIFNKGIVKASNTSDDNRWIVNGILRRSLEGSVLVKDTPIKFIVKWNGFDSYATILEMMFIQDMSLLQDKTPVHVSEELSKYRKHKEKGKAIRLNITRERSPDFLYGYDNKYYTDPKWRRGNDSLQSVLLYVNLQNGSCDYQTTIQEKTFHDFIIDDLHQGDVLTLIPNNKTYKEINCVVEDSAIEKKYLSIEFLKRRMNLNGYIKDEMTKNTVKNVKLGIYSVNPYGESTNRLMGYDEGVKKPYTIFTTKENGYFGFINCFADYSYYIKITPPFGYKKNLQGVNVRPINNIDSLIVYLSPTKLKGKVLDGKRNIANAKISYKSLYNDSCYTSINGDFEILGLTNYLIEVSASNYKTLILDLKDCYWRLSGIFSERPIVVKMQKGNTSDRVYGEYIDKKDKIRFNNKIR